MVQGIMTKFGFLGVALLLAAGCSSVDDDGAESTNQDNEERASLPAFEANGGEGDCVVGYNEKTIKEWLQAGDGLIIGTVESVEPALDPGWVRNPPDDFDEERLRNPDECDEMRYGFKVELKDLEGYLHDSDLPDTETMYFGYSHRFLFPTDTLPDIDDDSVTWPDSTQQIEEGMRIGGLAHEDGGETQRWSLLMSGTQPIFEVTNGDIEYQEIGFAEYEYCGYFPPFDEIESLGESGLLDEIDAFDQGDLYIDSEERDWTSLPRNQAPNWNPGPWVAACHIDGLWDDEDDPDCLEDADCDGPEVCSGGECVDV